MTVSVDPSPLPFSWDKIVPQVAKPTVGWGNTPSQSWGNTRGECKYKTAIASLRLIGLSFCCSMEQRKRHSFKRPRRIHQSKSSTFESSTFEPSTHHCYHLETRCLSSTRLRAQTDPSTTARRGIQRKSTARISALSKNRPK
jgi:hypothetical protein